MVDVGKFVLNVFVPVIAFAPLNSAYDVNDAVVANGDIDVST